MPAPAHFYCEKAESKTITLLNFANTDINPLFIVDRRIKGSAAFVMADLSHEAQPSRHPRQITLKPIPMAQWPAAAIKPFRKALLDAGLFEAEADSLIKIWRPQLFESNGLVAFHIIPCSEYDRMLPLRIVPDPPSRPIRVGIAHHPNLEIEPALLERVVPLLGQLDDPRFDKREAASKKLLQIGPLAIGMLRAELRKSLSNEQRRRIQAVLDRVDATEWLRMPVVEKKKEKPR